MIKAKRIIVDSIKDHLIPQVSSKKTPKEIFDSLTKLYERKNINQKMNLRTQLKNTRMQKGEAIQDFWTSAFGTLVLLVFWYFWYFVKTRVSLSGRSNHRKVALRMPK